MLSYICCDARVVDLWATIVEFHGHGLVHMFQRLFAVAMKVVGDFLSLYVRTRVGLCVIVVVRGIVEPTAPLSTRRYPNVCAAWHCRL